MPWQEHNLVPGRHVYVGVNFDMWLLAFCVFSFSVYSLWIIRIICIKFCANPETLLSILPTQILEVVTSCYSVTYYQQEKLRQWPPLNHVLVFPITACTYPMPIFICTQRGTMKPTLPWKWPIAKLSKYQKHIRVLYSRFIGVSDHVEFLFNLRPFDKGKLVC